MPLPLTTEIPSLLSDPSGAPPGRVRMYVRLCAGVSRTEGAAPLPKSPAEQ